MTTVRGITSGIKFIWKSENRTLIEAHKSARYFEIQNLDVYNSTYTISPLSVNDDGRTYHCEVVIEANPPIVATSNVTLDVTVPSPTVSITPSGPIQGAMVGNPQDIQCTVNTVSGVELNSVMISWTGPGGDTIRNDSRVTISPTSGSGNNYTNSLQFVYLMEGDEGIYVCSVFILETFTSISMKVNNLNGKQLFY